jgi:hypothetical protein
VDTWVAQNKSEWQLIADLQECQFPVSKWAMDREVKKSILNSIDVIDVADVHPASVTEHIRDVLKE